VREYGLLGVGEIAAAIVTGLCEGVEEPPTVLLSPRSRERAAALADRHPSVSVAPDNQALVDGCAVLVLAIRPQDARAILGGLRFRPDQPVISLLAGVSLAGLAELVAPARDLARAIPLPPVARRAGFTPVHPASAAACDLFGRLGEAAVIEDEDAFGAMSVASGTIAAHLRYLAAIGRWLSRQGVAPEQASRYVASVFAGVTLGEGDDLAELARSYATPGGINERFAALLDEAGAFDLVERSLQAIRDG
jgi:pyrroline-5-carboxylate reductase